MTDYGWLLRWEHTFAAVGTVRVFAVVEEATHDKVRTLVHYFQDERPYFKPVERFIRDYEAIEVSEPGHPRSDQHERNKLMAPQPQETKQVKENIRVVEEGTLQGNGQSYLVLGWDESDEKRLVALLPMENQDPTDVQTMYAYPCTRCGWEGSCAQVGEKCHS